MLNLSLAALAFAGIHLLIAGTRARDALVGRLGEQGFRALFSVASAVLLAWLIWAYIRARVPLPTPVAGLRGAADVLLFVAFVLIGLGLMTRAPTAVGAERLLERGDAARGIHRVTRHPFLWGIALWAVTHAVLNPEPVNLVFFGTFAGVALLGTASIDAKRARRFGAHWQRYAATTSNIPFAAIAQGRNRFVAGELGFVKILVVAVAYGAVVALHTRFFGLPAY